MKSKIIWSLILAVIIFIPLVTHNHVYNGIVGYDQPRSDFRDYVTMINGIAGGQPVGHILYPAQAIIGYPLAILKNLTGIKVDTLYITLCFVGLLGAVLLIYNCFGLLPTIISVFCASGILSLFSYGMIASIINMYVILLAAIYTLVKWLETDKIKYFISGVLLVIIFSLFHLTAFYLPYMVVSVIGLLCLIKLFKKISIEKPILLLSELLIINVMITYFVFGGSKIGLIPARNVAAIANGGEAIVVSNMPLTTSFFVSQYLTISVLALGLIVLAGIIVYRKKLEISRYSKMTLIALSGVSLPLIVGTFTSLSPEPVRTAVDCVTLLALLIATMLGILLKNKDTLWLKVSAYSFIGYGTISNLIIWVR